VKVADTNHESRRGDLCRGLCRELVSDFVAKSA